ncbi:hypothetical protein SprV_0100467300 [Sparganum proliferum]
MRSTMLNPRWLILLQTLVLVVTGIFAHEEVTQAYELCKGEHTNCTLIGYRAEDETKGNGCRVACGRKRGELSEKTTVYFCEERNETCKPYEAYGRIGYAENFERHVMCVSLCQLVGKAQHSSYDGFEMCSSTFDSCTEIKKRNGTFDAFNKCAFKCDGWPELDKTLEDIAIFCHNETDGYENLRACLTDCMPRE